MPTPTVRDVHTDVALTNVSVAYKNGLYLYDQVFPTVGVTKQSDFYYIFDKGAWFRDLAARRAPGTRSQRADYSLTTGSYICENYALAKGIPDEVRKNSDAPLRPDVEATEFVTDALMRSREGRVATIVTTCTNWASASTVGTQWSDDTSDPVGDIWNAINSIVKLIGRMPNVGLFSWDVWQHLRQHPDMLDRIKYTRPGGNLTTQDIATMFDLPKVLVGTSLTDSSTEGNANSLSYVWGDYFWVGYVAPAPALMTPSAGYVLEWNARTVNTYREDQEHQDVIEAMEYTDEVITASDAGALLANVV